MSFRATNYSVAILLLMAFTIGMMIVRSKKPLENNWPLFYWILVLILTLKYPEDTWDFRAVMVGAAAGFILRFEFMNNALVRLVRVVEFGAWLFILYSSLLLITN